MFVPVCHSFETSRRREVSRAGDNRMIEFPYLVMFRNENGHFVSVGGG